VSSFRYVRLALLVAFVIATVALCAIERGYSSHGFLVPLAVSLLLQQLTSQFRWSHDAFVRLRCAYIIATLAMLVSFCICARIWFHQ
jgi:hypothetical protein